MDFRSLVANAIRVEQPRLNGFLVVIEGYVADSSGLLEQAAIPAPLRLRVDLEPTDYAFDEQSAAWFFSATRGWREVDISLDELRAIMPPGVVSPKARGVSVWPPIVRALTRTVSYATRSGSQLLSAVTGGEDTYLTAIDLEDRPFACSCPAYLSEKLGDPRRHILCKHLMLSIYHFSDILLEKQPHAEAWRKAKRECVRRGIYYVVNWIYYFIRRVFAGLGFQAGVFRDEKHVCSVLERLSLA